MVQRGSGLGVVNETRLVLLVFQLTACQKLEGYRTVEFDQFWTKWLPTRTLPCAPTRG